MVRILASSFALLCLAAHAQPYDITVSLFKSGFTRPVLVTHAGDGSGRLFVVEQRGKLKVIDSDGTVLATPFLDLGIEGLDKSFRPISGGDERGFLGLAFHPDYENNGRFFVHYTRRPDNVSIIEEYSVSAGNPNIADTTATPVLSVIQPEGNHNGGHLAFGPDGMLYISLGDGGGGGDEHGTIGNAQDPTNLLGKILRIDVDSGSPYAIPPDNPFVGDPNALDEIFAYGFRNPWRFSFDALTGVIFCGDVGQGTYEEVDIVEAGKNYGWRCYEGFHPYNTSTSNCDDGDFVEPIYEYSHSSGRCSMTGGYVYRGTRSPQIQGFYFYGDYCTGEVWVLHPDGEGGWINDPVADLSFNVSSFGEDEDGELYICDLFGGTLNKIEGPEETVSVSSWRFY